MPEIKPYQIMQSQVHHLHAESFGDTYKIAVWLPPDYDTSTMNLPCIYVLDEPEFFGFASAVALNYYLRDTPVPMMIVAIGKDLDTLDDWWSIRWRDFSPTTIESEPLSGHADDFLQFLSQQVIPFIDSTYRADTTQRTLWGHSLGGLFAIYTLSQHPDLFKNYIATSPAFVVDNHELVDYKQLIPAMLSEAKKLYVSVGDAELEFKPAVDDFAKTVSAENLDFTYEALAGLSHMPAALTGFLKGLERVLY